MNVLLDTLPDTVNIGGREYQIETDYRAGIKFETMIQRGETRVFELMRPWYGDYGYPKDLHGAVEAAMWFYRCGTGENTNGTEKPARETQRVSKQPYSFDMDADAIFSSFWQAYHIDLTAGNLHWWKFRRLLMGLPEESEFRRRVYIRTCELKDLSKKQKEHILKQRKMIEIRQGGKQTLEERNEMLKAYVARRLNEASKEVI